MFGNSKVIRYLFVLKYPQAFEMGITWSRYFYLVALAEFRDAISRLCTCSLILSLHLHAKTVRDKSIRRHKQGFPSLWTLGTWLQVSFHSYEVVQYRGTVSARELEKQKPLILTAANLVFDCLHISFDISRRHTYTNIVIVGGGDEVHFF